MLTYRCILRVHICFFLLTYAFASRTNDLDEYRRTKLFANDLYKAVTHHMSANKGFLIAPFSIKEAITILYLGANGTTKNELHRVLQVWGGKSIIAKAIPNPISISKSQFELTTSTVMFIDDQLSLTNRFIALTNNFKLKRKYIDLSNKAQAVQEINDYVEDFSKNILSSFLKRRDINNIGAGLLVNLVRINAHWKKSFEKQKVMEKFFTSSDKFKLVEMMQQVNSFKYKKHKGLNAEVIELPLKREINMLIFLPTQVENGTLSLEKELVEEDLFKISKKLTKTKLLLKLPLFKLSTRIYLEDTLKEMGIHKAFTSGGDFSEMFEQKSAHLSNMVQEIFLQITPSSVVAANTVGSKLRTRARKKEFVVNRPFVFVIKSKKSIYLMGRYNM